MAKHKGKGDSDLSVKITLNKPEKKPEVKEDEKKGKPDSEK